MVVQQNKIIAAALYSFLIYIDLAAINLAETLY
jgi:hypothetical protein